MKRPSRTAVIVLIVVGVLAYAAAGYFLIVADFIHAAQQRGIGTAVAEHRLVGIPSDDSEFGARRQHSHQPGRLRIEMLRVIEHVA